MDLSIILPCAGTGSRLGLDIPKELYEIYPEVKLIDFSLMHIKKYITLSNAINIKIITIILESKVKVYEYIKSKLPVIDIYPVIFNENYYEWAGSVYSAKKYFSKYNIVLLPDSFIQVSDNNIYFNNSRQTLIDLMLQSLKINHVSFCYVNCNDENKLQKLGAIKVFNGNILNFQDKPVSNYSNYNAFWATYGFQKEYAKKLYRFLVRSIKHQKVDYSKESFYPAGGIKLHSYFDLGTWESIDSFKKLYSENNNKLFK